MSWIGTSDRDLLINILIDKAGCQRSQLSFAHRRSESSPLALVGDRDVQLELGNRKQRDPLCGLGEGAGERCEADQHPLRERARLGVEVRAHDYLF